MLVPVHAGAVTVNTSPSYRYPPVHADVDPSRVKVAVYFSP